MITIEQVARKENELLRKVLSLAWEEEEDAGKAAFTAIGIVDMATAIIALIDRAGVKMNEVEE